jgi:hypothetical protein
MHILDDTWVKNNSKGIQDLDIWSIQVKVAMLVSLLSLKKSRKEKKRVCQGLLNNPSIHVYYTHTHTHTPPDNFCKSEERQPHHKKINKM